MTESEKRDAAFEAWWCSPEAKKVTQHADRRAAAIGFQAAYALLAPEMRDAARYRWLRNPNHDIEPVIDHRLDGATIDGMPAEIYEYRSGEDLDRAIDTAIAAMETKHATE